MKKQINKILISLFFISKVIGNHIIHEKVEEASTYSPCRIEAFVDVSDEQVQYFNLLYRSFGNVEFLETQMIPLGHSKYFSEIHYFNDLFSEL